ncbi:MAG: XTP/dITP diphosphatase [Nitrososphaerota archaeon]|jgi:XTP/dITP diphosphohydrolase|uniref:XTP/dITP diphosphatase n=1 Tax=Candidatus Bathycorpusculum sp. TaxID=2994959 RepID=UPI00281E6F04|nr:XTP/dITP diphosphatase [Candidatus Termitimicrobium sp.]MCL2432614.1 XTP/dITP diphosphatase [Candidatus Termitimicrobium sp.]MDR0493633.1 XTP/dITP diphosphatase [Nitrososphaerota archaeon]
MLKNANPEFPLKGKMIFFATANIHKFNEARHILGNLEIAIGMLKLKGDEIQSDNLQEIAEKSVQTAYKQCLLPIIVEDAGLFIDTLQGFPGPYAAYAYKTLNNNGILKLLENKENRQATFKSIISYCDDQTRFDPLSFYGQSQGTITTQERHGQDKRGFGFDPIFQPNNSPKTFAEMTMQEKNSHSHRAEALHKFAQWYKSNHATE